MLAGHLRGCTHMKQPVGNLIAEGNIGLLYISEVQLRDGHTNCFQDAFTSSIFFKSVALPEHCLEDNERQRQISRACHLGVLTIKAAALCRASELSLLPERLRPG